MEKLRGLTREEVVLRQKKYGLNELSRKRKFGWIGKIVMKIFNPLILLLIVSSLLSIGLNQKTDFWVIIAILGMSVAMDGWQEHRAEKSAEKLLKKVSMTSWVIRDGIKSEILAADLTVGDVVMLSIGEIVPADGLVLERKDLEVNQAALTGESFPAEKNKGDGMLMGSFVVAGEGVMVVTRIGSQTQIGKISTQLVKPRPPTDFENSLRKFSLMLVRAAVVMSAILLIINLVLGHPWGSSLMFVSAILIGFAPELLPMILSINLANGALKLSKKGVLVKFLPAIENFGSMDVLCTDKTGTLTAGTTSLSGTINIEGKIDNQILKLVYLNSFFQAGFKNPLEFAILKHKQETKGYRKVDEKSFDFYRRRVSVLVVHGSQTLLITKGAPEEILQIVDNKKSLKCDYELFNRQGLRTLAVATKVFPKTKKTIEARDETGMELQGFVTFTDPPKSGVEETLGLMERLKVDLKILTGDNEVITKYICDQLKLPVKGMLLGEELLSMGDEELKRRVETTTIFAKLNPEAKQKIILALKENGHVVGYLGDGINDATSLRTADVGISVNNAVSVAKESADLILLHKDLSVLLVGVEVGRKTFTNIYKYVMMGTSSTFGNMVTLAVSSLFLPFLPLLPLQVLLNDMLYDISQLLLVEDEVDSEAVSQPRKWSLKFVNRFMLAFGLSSCIIDAIIFGVMLWVFHTTPTMFQTGLFTESLLMQMVVVFSIRTQRVPFWKSRTNPIFAASMVIMTAVVLVLPYISLGRFFHLVPLPTVFYLVLGIVVMVYLAMDEGLKKWFYGRTN